jgi:hypothetical protein
MAKFDYKKWVVENKYKTYNNPHYGSLNEQEQPDNPPYCPTMADPGTPQCCCDTPNTPGWSSYPTFWDAPDFYTETICASDISGVNNQGVDVWDIFPYSCCNMNPNDCMEYEATGSAWSCNTCSGCVEDSNGPFSSLEECQASGCFEGSLEEYAISLGISPEVNGMSAEDQFCIKCQAGSYDDPKCNCCNKGKDISKFKRRR